MVDLSIVIPHFNSSKLLEKLLLTIPNTNSIEVIVIDDYSSSKEFSLLQNLHTHQKRKFSLYQNNSIKSAGTCRNIGISNAKGRWLLFADSDDYFSNDFYENVSKYFNSNNDVVFFKPTSVYIDSDILADRHEKICKRLDQYLNNKNLESLLSIKYKLETPWSKLINRNFLIKNSIKFEEVLASNDLLFSTRVGYNMSLFKISSDIIYITTRNHNSLTLKLTQDIFEIRLSEKIKYFTYLKTHLTKEEIKLLNISFLDFLIKSYNYGIRFFFSTLLKFIKSGLPIMDKRLLNITSLKNLFKTYITMKKVNKKYFTKEQYNEV